MNISRSVLGVRFNILSVGPEEEILPKLLFEELFSVLTVADLRGMDVYAGVSGDDNNTFCVVFSNGKFKKLKRIYKKLKADLGLSVYLAANRPFIDYNRASKLTGMAYYGCVKLDGRLAGGECGIFGLVVPKKHGKRRPVGKGLKILLAPNSFKGSLSAIQVIRLLTIAARRHFPGTKIVPVPIADGGDGSLEAFAMCGGGEYRQAEVTDPIGRKINAKYYVYGGRTAVIEMAQASGLRLLSKEEQNPLLTSSAGVGEIIVRALDEGLRDIHICVGGSATNDGGMGCARALGVRFFDASGNELTGCGADLARVSEIDTQNVHHALKSASFTVICDVKNILTGEDGATAVYAAQKGADADMISVLEAGMLNYAKVLNEYCGLDIASVEGAGAAGGIGAMFAAVFGAELKHGINTVLDHINFDEMLSDVSLVVTGEGCVDNQTITGNKAVLGVVERCEKAGIPVAIIAGSITDEAKRRFSKVGTITLTSANIPAEYCMLNAERLLLESAEELFKLIKTGREMD